jgi:hypothetical protein
MRIFVCFLRFKDFEPAAMVYGEFRFVDLLFVQPSRITKYFTRPRENYGRRLLFKDVMSNSENWTARRVFLELPVSEDEGERLLRTCETFASVETHYNLMDGLFYVIPMRVAKERTLFQTDELSDTQAVILMLRECLSSETSQSILNALKCLNSRQTMPETLYETLLPVTRRLTWMDLFRILP